MELEEGTFYQMSYDGPYVPIIADYPGLLPSSHISNPKTPSPKETSPFLLTHRTILCSKGEGFGTTYRSKGTSEEGGPYSGRVFQEESKRRHGRTFIEEVRIRQHAPEQSRPTMTFPFSMCQEKGAPDYILRFERPYFPQPGFKSCRDDGG